MAEEGMELGDGVSVKEEKTSNEESLTGTTLLTGDKQESEVMVEMELIYDEENPIKDEVMEAQSESLEEPQQSSLKPISFNVKKNTSKLKKRIYSERIARLARRRQSSGYENYVMALKLQSLELDSKIKENLLKKCKLDITLSKMERKIKEYKLRKMEIDLAKSKLEYIMLQTRNRTVTI